MQKKSYLVYFLLLIMTCSINGSCQAQNDRKDKSTSGKTKENREVSNFNSLDLSISADVHLRQGSPTSVVLEGEADDLDKVVTDVSGSELKIKTRQGSWNIHHITVYVTMENIKNLNVSGSGSIKAETDVKSDNLNLEVTGSGNINLPNLIAQNISSVISGSGNIYYSGKNSASTSKLVVTGSGNINAEDFSSKDANVTITGSGDCKVNATDNLNVLITGSGSVLYKGKALVNASVTGSGKVRQSI